MDSDDDDSFFARNVGGSAAGPPPRRRQHQPARAASPNPFQADPDFDIDLNIDSDDNVRLNASGLGVDGEEDETPLQQLIRHWMNERHAPDILPAQQVLLAGLLDHIRRQVRIMCLHISPS